MGGVRPFSRISRWRFSCGVSAHSQMAPEHLTDTVVLDRDRHQTLSLKKVCSKFRQDNTILREMSRLIHMAFFMNGRAAIAV